MGFFQKSYRVFQQRGLSGLIRRIVEYLFSNAKDIFFLLFIKKGDVLFVSGCPGGSRFYRCGNQAEKLNFLGFKTKVVDQNSSLLPFLITKFEVFIFQRVIYNNQIAKIIKEIKKQKKEIIFETDDLVFDPQYLPFMDYFKYMGEEEKSWYENGIGREILEDDYVKKCIVSTDYLAKKIKEKYPKKKVLVSYNVLNKKQLFWAERALRNKEKIRSGDKKIRLGYFSGSKSHDADFKMIMKTVLSILKENKKVILFIVGDLKLNEKFLSFKEQIERSDFVPIEKLSELILRCDINLAPLEIDNPFCQAKSALKFFEAGILGVPTLATATESFCRFIQDGKTGFLAKDENEWRNKLEILIKNGELREKMGLAAREFVKDNLVTNNKESEFFSFLNQK